MPWKESDKVSERTKFIAKLLNGERMTDVCREFEISRVTGHKIWKRYQDEGVSGFLDRSSKPWKLANKTPAEIEKAIIKLKGKYPTWGAPKLKSYLERKQSTIIWPSKSTVHAILDRHGLVKHRIRTRSYKAEGTSLGESKASNEIWCADFKGQFKTQDGKYCYPLTVSDHYSRFLLSCEALENSREVQAISCFKTLFKEYGLPDAIRTDNGSPFSTRTLFGLSKLSILWLRLGIHVERITPGHPEQNGRHERMHRTLKESTAKPSAKNLIQQQEKFEDFKIVYNHDRPHEALKMKSPAEVYKPSKKQYPNILDEYDYSKSDATRRVCSYGAIKMGNKKVFISEAFAYQELGLNRDDDGLWTVNFMGFRIGYFSDDSPRFSPGPNPFMNLDQ